MNKSARDHNAGLVDPSRAETVEVLGPTVQFLTPVEPDPAIGENGPCVMRGTVPAGVVVPFHSHADPETFLLTSGEVEAFIELAGGFKTVRVRPGDIFHVPGGAKHAWRNNAQEPTVMTIVSPHRMARFLREVGMPVGVGNPQGTPAPADRILRFAEAAQRYGHWNASPEENARLGIELPSAA